MGALTAVTKAILRRRRCWPMGCTLSGGASSTTGLGGSWGRGWRSRTRCCRSVLGRRTTPNLRATEVQLSDGMVLKSVNCWPSANHDFAAINSKLTRFLPPGFYYKTFMWPRRMWSTYEGIIRKAAGLGESPRAPDPDIYDRMNAHCDVLIAGGGPAGLAAALEAGATGARVILADDGAEFGGNLLSSRRTIEGLPARDWVKDAVRQAFGDGGSEVDASELGVRVLRPQFPRDSPVFHPETGRFPSPPPQPAHLEGPGETGGYSLGLFREAADISQQRRAGGDARLCCVELHQSLCSLAWSQSRCCSRTTTVDIALPWTWPTRARKSGRW